MSVPDLDELELAATRILARLVESQGVQFVSSRGVTALAGGAAHWLARIGSEPERAGRFADWLMDQVEVVDLFVDDERLEAILAEEWDGIPRAGVGAGAGPTARSPSLEAEILAAPETLEPYLVYGDWLQARGDLYGELIIRQVAAHGPGGSAADLRRAYAFLDAHAGALLGPMAEYLRKVIHLDWHMGFIRGARIGRDPADADSYQGDIMLRWLVEHRASLLLASLELESCERQRSGQTQAMVEVLSARPPARLHSLRITGGRDEVELGRLLDVLPQLRELALSAQRLSLRPMSLAHLSRLELALGMVGDGVQSLLSSSLPELESLTLLGYAPVDGPAFTPLYDRPFPKLRHLRTRGYDQLLERLAGSALLAQLEVLDLSGGGLRDEAIRDILIPRRRHFHHLERLILDDNALGEATVNALFAQLGTVQISAARQSPAYEVDDDDEFYDDAME